MDASTVAKSSSADSKPQPTPRIRSVDGLRGLVMIIMALDHVREFFYSSAIRPEDLVVADEFRDGNVPAA